MVPFVLAAAAAALRRRLFFQNAGDDPPGVVQLMRWRSFGIDPVLLGGGSTSLVDRFPIAHSLHPPLAAGLRNRACYWQNRPDFRAAARDGILQDMVQVEEEEIGRRISRAMVSEQWGGAVWGSSLAKELDKLVVGLPREECGHLDWESEWYEGGSLAGTRAVGSGGVVDGVIGTPVLDGRTGLAWRNRTLGGSGVLRHGGGNVHGGSSTGEVSLTVQRVFLSGRPDGRSLVVDNVVGLSGKKEEKSSKQQSEVPERLVFIFTASSEKDAEQIEAGVRKRLAGGKEKRSAELVLFVQGAPALDLYAPSEGRVVGEIDRDNGRFRNNATDPEFKTHVYDLNVFPSFDYSAVGMDYEDDEGGVGMDDAAVEENYSRQTQLLDDQLRSAVYRWGRTWVEREQKIFLGKNPGATGAGAGTSGAKYVSEEDAQHRLLRKLKKKFKYVFVTHNEHGEFGHPLRRRLHQLVLGWANFYGFVKPNLFVLQVSGDFLSNGRSSVGNGNRLCLRTKPCRWKGSVCHCTSKDNDVVAFRRPRVVTFNN